MNAASSCLRSLRRVKISGVEVLCQSFTTSAPSCSRRQVLVQLLEDVDGLGNASDRILVAPGRARNSLIPTRQAKFVPWKRASDKEVRRVAPNVPFPSDLLSHPRSTLSIAAPPEVVAAIADIRSTLEFPHRTISPNSPTIFGSVTLGDVVKRLEDAGIPEASVVVKWADQEEGARMKELGQWRVSVTPIGGEERILTVGVTRMP